MPAVWILLGIVRGPAGRWAPRPCLVTSWGHRTSLKENSGKLHIRMGLAPESAAPLLETAQGLRSAGSLLPLCPSRPDSEGTWHSQDTAPLCILVSHMGSVTTPATSTKGDLP